jgi:hypothetical protein
MKKISSWIKSGLIAVLIYIILAGITFLWGVHAQHVCMNTGCDPDPRMIPFAIVNLPAVLVLLFLKVSKPFLTLGVIVSALIYFVLGVLVGKLIKRM